MGTRFSFKVSEEDQEIMMKLAGLNYLPAPFIPFQSGLIGIAVPVNSPTHYIFVQTVTNTQGNQKEKKND